MKFPYKTENTSKSHDLENAGQYRDGKPQGGVKTGGIKMEH